MNNIVIADKFLCNTGIERIESDVNLRFGYSCGYYDNFVVIGDKLVLFSSPGKGNAYPDISRGIKYVALEDRTPVNASYSNSTRFSNYGRKLFEYIAEVKENIKIYSRDEYKTARCNIYRVKPGYFGKVISSRIADFRYINFLGNYVEITRTDGKQPPVISGEDLDLGSKTEDFKIKYIVTDSDGGDVKVNIFVDEVKKVADKVVNLGREYEYQILLNEFTLGQHTVKIVANDGMIDTTRTYTFYKTNSAPVISGEDSDLGEKSTPFTIKYTVTDVNNDEVNVSVMLDSEEIQTFNSAQNKELSTTINEDRINSYEVGETHTITIKADDTKGGVSYRRYTFTKSNTAPIISGTDEDLGVKKEEFSIEYSVTDLEEDRVNIQIYLDDELLKEVLDQESGYSENFQITHDRFIKIPYGNHKIKIVAWDELNQNKKSIRQFNFNRQSKGLEVIAKIAELDERPKKILAVAHGVFTESSTLSIFATNNYLDDSPTWEDITQMSKIARAHTFTNQTKTNEKYAIAIKIICEDEMTDISSILRGIKGGFE